jgi:hypothetical protein
VFPLKLGQLYFLKCKVMVFHSTAPLVFIGFCPTVSLLTFHSKSVDTWNLWSAPQSAINGFSILCACYQGFGRSYVARGSFTSAHLSNHRCLNFKAVIQPMDPALPANSERYPRCRYLWDSGAASDAIAGRFQLHGWTSTVRARIIFGGDSRATVRLKGHIIKLPGRSQQPSQPFIDHSKKANHSKLPKRPDGKVFVCRTNGVFSSWISCLHRLDLSLLILLLFKSTNVVVCLRWKLILRQRFAPIILKITAREALNSLNY